MLNSKFVIRIFLIGGLIFIACPTAPAQRNDAVKDNALAKFEKSIEEGDYAAVERDLLNYAVANQTNARAFELLGRLRQAQNRLSEARSLFQKALSLDPNSVIAKINLAVINFQTGNSGQAISLLNEINENSLSGDVLRLKLAQAFVLVGDCRKARNNIEKLNIKIRKTTALPVSAGCYLQTGEKQKAVLLIPSAKNLARQNSAAAIKFAEVLAGAGMYKESADVLRSVVSAAPQNADALILLARAEIYTNDFSKAKIHLNRAAKINPNAPDLLFTGALLESEQGKDAEALILLEKSLEAAPDSPVILSRLVVSAMRAGHSSKAVKAAEKLLALNSGAPEFIYLYGAASLQNNSLRAAEDSLKRFLELRPEDSRGCLALGLTYAAQNDKFEKARAQLSHCIEMNPRDVESIYQLGLSYKTQGEPAKAVEYLERATALAPNYARALRDLGAVYLQTGAEMKARAALEKSVSINPNDADTHFQLSRLYNLIGETHLAKKHLEQFQKLKNPDKTGM